MNSNVVPFAIVAAVLMAVLFGMRAMGVSRMTSAQARELIAAGGTLIDVRSPTEFQSGHLPGAINIPVNQMDARIAEIPSGRPVVLYCASGMRSEAAAGKLRRAGRTEVFNLGAMSRWNE